MVRQMIRKWGNSPAIRLPAAVMKAAHLTLEQSVDVRVEQGRIVIEPAMPTYSLDELLAGITPGNRHGEADFGPCQGQEQI
jgi:antitoxin MazE